MPQQYKNKRKLTRSDRARREDRIEYFEHSGSLAVTRQRRQTGRLPSPCNPCSATPQNPAASSDPAVRCRTWCFPTFPAPNTRTISVTDNGRDVNTGRCARVSRTGSMCKCPSKSRMFLRNDIALSCFLLHRASYWVMYGLQDCPVRMCPFSISVAFPKFWTFGEPAVKKTMFDGPSAQHPTKFRSCRWIFLSRQRR